MSFISFLIQVQVLVKLFVQVEVSVIVLFQLSVIFLVDMRRVVETGMIGIHTPSSGQIIISCRSIVMFAKSSATKFISIFPLHSIF